VVENKTGQILGVALLAVDSHEMINTVKTVMDAGLPYTQLRDQIFTHPSMSEALNDLFSLVK
jgi:pyruvate/2-oxoglutarate dehydrogenase complex dihydrolipoamide dehydrogenase (E3) component